MQYPRFEPATSLSRRAMVGALASTFAHTAFAGLPRPALDKDPILIGQSAVLTGPAARLGLEMRDGILAEFKHTNNEGGINGRPLKLVTLDDGYEPERCVENTLKLVQECTALVGYVGTPTTSAALDIINKAGIPLVGPFTGASVFRNLEKSPTLYNIRASYADEAPHILRQLTVIHGNATKIAIAIQDDAYGQAVKSVVEAEMVKLGMKFCALATIKRNSLEITAAAKVLADSGCDGVVLGLTYEPAALLMQAVRKAGTHPQFASVSFIGTGGLLEEFPDVAKGLGITQVVPSPTALSKRLIREYQSAMTAMGVNKFTYGSVEGYIAGSVLVEALKRAAANPTRTQIAQTLDNLTLDLGGFTVAFSPGNHAGSKFIELSVVSQQGKMIR